MTTTQTITVRDLIAAARAFAMGDLPDSAPLSTASVGIAGVVSVEVRKGRERRELIDGMHRAAGLAAWAGDDEDRLNETVTVVVTDDSDLVVAILARKDAGQDDVSDLIEAALG